MSAAFKSVAVLGGTGFLGKTIVSELLARKVFDVTVITRPGTKDASKQALLDQFTAKGAKIVEADVTKVDDLAQALKGSEVVISTVKGDDALEDGQTVLLEAAKKAGVKRFIPSEFGSDGTAYKQSATPTPKSRFQDLLTASGLEYTIIYNGVFSEMLVGPFNDIDTEKRTIVVYGDLNTRFTTTHTKDIAKVVAEVLLKPDASRNKTVRVGAQLTHAELIKALEEASGQKYQVTQRPVSELEEKTKSTDPHAAHVAWIKIFFAQGYGYFDAVDNDTYNAKPITFQEYAKEVVGRKEE
ncbi:hypothetical protein HK104_007717 [Borealophlyctis nickersoniae]|nr:hypothetical protein HK104_007717 [Borealophlyctis nickersoniae]